MQIDNRFLDDFARVASGALGVASRVKDELAQMLRLQLEKALSGVELVTREEFEAVKAMAAEARAEQERLSERLNMLEAKLTGAAAKRKGAHKGHGDPEGE